jgi:hypothetical protein
LAELLFFAPLDFLPPLFLRALAGGFLLVIATFLGARD